MKESVKNPTTDAIASPDSSERLWRISHLALASWMSPAALVSVLHQVAAEFDVPGCFLVQPPESRVVFSRDQDLTDDLLQRAIDLSAFAKGPGLIKSFTLPGDKEAAYGLVASIARHQGESIRLGLVSRQALVTEGPVGAKLEALSRYLGLALEHAWLVRRLRQANRHLRDMDRLKNEFISNVTHELKTPLTTIKLAAQTLAKHPPKEMQDQFVDMILHEADRLNRMISNVLTLSKIQDNNALVKFQIFSPYSLVMEAFDSLKLLAAQRNIQLVCQGPEEHVSGDANMVNQIIVNLLSNAIKYGKPDSQVVVELFFEPQEWTLKVTDQGEGISEEDQEKLFTPFFRLENAQLKAEGTGLGLYLISKLAQKMKGLVGVRSQEGQGSCFWVILPKNPALMSKAA